MALVDSTAPGTALSLTYNNNNNISDLNTNSFISGDAYTLVIYSDVPEQPYCVQSTWLHLDPRLPCAVALKAPTVSKDYAIDHTKVKCH